MDELTESLGHLSTNAKEWKPSSQQQATAAQPSSSHSSAAVPLAAASASPYFPQSPKPSTQQRPTVTSSVLQHSPPGRKVTLSNSWQQQQGVGGDWQPPAEFVPSWQRQQQEPLTKADRHETGHQPQAQQASAHNQAQEETTTSMAATMSSTVPAGPAPPLPVRTMHSLGVSDELWRHQRRVALESLKEMDPADPKHKAIPPPFSNPYQLDDDTTTSSTGTTSTRSSFGYPTSVFKCLNQEDGNLYCLRRFDNVRSVSYKIANAVTERWTQQIPTLKSGVSPVSHPGVVRFYNCFVSNRAIFFQHAYLPCARTLKERFTNHNLAMPEPLLWSCIVQLVAAIRTIHAANLACRVLQLNHILCTSNISPDDGDNMMMMMMDRGSLRLQINCLGVPDALEFEARKPVGELQREDMRDLGRLILSLASGMEINSRNSSTDSEIMRRCNLYLSQNYSRELFNLAFSLLTPNVNATPSIHDVCRVISGRVFDEMDVSRVAANRTEAALSAEYESGRALRLLLKLGFVNERPEFGMNRRWTESGDCYVLMLFRDYVFHQADGSGRPIMDLGHVVTSLNKLDAADDERIVLTSRDGKSMFVVSYAEVAQCLDNAFNELCGGAAGIGSMPAGGGRGGLPQQQQQQYY